MSGSVIPSPSIPRALVLAMVALGLAGCPRPMTDLAVLPQGQPLSLEDERVARVLERHAEEAKQRSGLTGSARVALEGPDFKLNRPQRIALARPGKLRFEILALFDQLAALLVTDGVEYGFYEAASGQVSQGRVSSALLWNLTKIDLSSEELVGLLLAIPRPEDGSLRAGAWLEPEGRLAIAFSWPEEEVAADCVAEDPLARAIASRCVASDRALLERGGQLFFFDPSDRLAEVRGLDPGGVIRYRVQFAEYETIGAADGPRFPKRVTLESPANASQARFQWKRVRFVPELADEVFRLPAAMRAGPGS